MHVHLSRIRAGRLGTIQVAATFQGVVRVQLDDDGDAMRAELLAQYPEAAFKRPSPVTTDAVRVIRDYLDGGPSPTEVPIVLPEVGFATRVWRQLQRIPHGTARTYGGVARSVRKPRAARAVGQACGRNPVPLLVPCHRVLAADCRLGGYSGGLDVKRALLELEGIEYRG
ncbi:MAG: methylated-DNA--[protein]-cysteine S-methyltransferase [Planctomycetota bacterium]|nr:methylated-DNA--[protein]-cysteine S-methyltransferase [Planctomycetota bacterium]